jgi:hypothetical protein
MPTSGRADGVGRGVVEAWHTEVGIGVAGVIRSERIPRL